MDKWHNQFDRLKRQWSEYNWMDSDYKPHDKRRVAKIGVAWVAKLPGENFRKPAGWEVEIIDTPLGISERSNNLFKWLKHPPTNVYDNISLFNDSYQITPNDSFDRHEIRSRKSYVQPFTPTEQRFTVPPNEYEIFKKTCCECKEKSFKNSSTDYESDVKTLAPREHTPYRLSVKNSYYDLPPSPRSPYRVERRSNPSEYSENEQEINNHILDAMTQSSIDHLKESIHSTRFSTPKNHKKNDSKSKTSKLTDQSVGTSNVLSSIKPYKEPSLISQPRVSVNNEVINGVHSPPPNHTINNNTINNNTVAETTYNDTPRRRSTGPHIPSINAFDDNLLSRGTSLDQYRTSPPKMSRTYDELSDYKRPSGNDHRNHHRHHRHRRNGSKEVSIDTTIDSNIVPSVVGDEYEANDVTM